VSAPFSDQFVGFPHRFTFPLGFRSLPPRDLRAGVSAAQWEASAVNEEIRVFRAAPGTSKPPVGWDWNAQR